jgi:hypothetical protein
MNATDPRRTAAELEREGARSTDAIAPAAAAEATGEAAERAGLPTPMQSMRGRAWWGISGARSPRGCGRSRRGRCRNLEGANSPGGQFFLSPEPIDGPDVNFLSPEPGTAPKVSFFLSLQAVDSLCGQFFLNPEPVDSPRAQFFLNREPADSPRAQFFLNREPADSPRAQFFLNREPADSPRASDGANVGARADGSVGPGRDRRSCSSNCSRARTSLPSQWCTSGCRKNGGVR